MAEAKAKTTKPKAKKETAEKVVENVKVEETKVEEPEVVAEEVKTEEPVVVEEKSEETEANAMVDALICKPINEEAVKEWEEEEALAEEEHIEQIVEEFQDANPTEKLQNLVDENKGNLGEALNNELKRVKKLEGELKSNIEKKEKNLAKNNGKRPERYVATYWNGISDGWNN